MDNTIVEEVLKEKQTLQNLIATVEHAYLRLCVLCQYDPERSLAENEMENTATKSNNRELTLYTGEVDEKEKRKYADIPKEWLSARTLYRKVKQATHPDKLLSQSAALKVKLIASFHACETAYREDDYTALVYCYVHVFLLKNQPKRIYPYMMAHVEMELHSVMSQQKAILNKPYISAVSLLISGDEKEAVRHFKHFLDMKNAKKNDMNDDDCF